MRINNNLMAMNTHRQLGLNQNASAKSIEKLSSGLRINRAGDDAAGLAISEKMRGQIRGLNQASRNSQDGISLIQTAEGALNESQAILQRMRELAVQSANETNVDADRGAIQSEISQLSEEVDRIANNTEFNTQNLLKGTGGTKLKSTGGIAGATLAGAEVAKTIEAKSTDAITTKFASGATAAYTLSGVELKVTFATGSSGTSVLKASSVTSTSATIELNTGTTLTSDATALREAYQSMIDANDTLAGNYTVTGSGDNIVIEAVKGGRFEGAVGSISLITTTGTGVVANTSSNLGEHVAAKAAKATIDFSTLVSDNASVLALVGDGMTINDVAIEFYNSNDGAYKGDALGVDLSAAIAATADKDDAVVAAIVAQTSNVDGVDLSSTGTNPETLVIIASKVGVEGNEIKIVDGATSGKDFSAEFQIGANEGQTMKIKISDMRSDALGIGELDIVTTAGAQSAITTIDDALASVSNERAKLGAFQNRLEHTIKNLDTSSENLQASESRIRDVDMAKEMMEFTKNNILSQAAQSMLAQANNAPQGVLQLLR